MKLCLCIPLLGVVFIITAALWFRSKSLASAVATTQWLYEVALLAPTTPQALWPRLLGPTEDLC